MKFIWNWELRPEDIDKVLEKSEKLASEIKKFPEKYPKLSPSYFTGRCKGFRLIEADNEEQLMNLLMYFYPEETWNLMLIFESSKMIERIQK